MLKRRRDNKPKLQLSSFSAVQAEATEREKKGKGENVYCKRFMNAREPSDRTGSSGPNTSRARVRPAPAEKGNAGQQVRTWGTWLPLPGREQGRLAFATSGPAHTLTRRGAIYHLATGW